MAKNHLKSIAAPNTWPISRKKNVFVTRPNPGAHKMLFGMPISVIMIDLIKCANTKKEVKSILKNKNVLIDGKKKSDDKNIVGLMDTISLKDIDEYYRIILSKKGKIMAIKIGEKETSVKPSKIIGKTVLKKGLIQLNLLDGRNIIVKNDDYKVGDSLVLSLPEQKINGHLKLENGMIAYLIGGKHMGETGVLESVEGSKIRVRTEKEVYETAKDYAFIIGKEKPVIALS